MKRVLMTERSMRLLRARPGVRVAKLEQWVPAPWLARNNSGEAGARPGGGVRRDAFGFVDLLVLAPPRAVGIQCCAMSGKAEHVAKILTVEVESGNVSAWLRCGLGIELHAWRKLKLFRLSKAVRWTCEVSSFALDSDGRVFHVPAVEPAVALSDGIGADPA